MMAVLQGIASMFAALCYSELASIIPVSGSAYTYSYATLGSFVGWTIGWDLCLEYLVSASASPPLVFVNKGPD
jgi:basic amino acid/polyamine antiporter, APA family